MDNNDRLWMLEDRIGRAACTLEAIEQRLCDEARLDLVERAALAGVIRELRALEPLALATHCARHFTDRNGIDHAAGG